MYRDPMLIIYATLNFHILFTFIYKIFKNEISIKSQMLNQSLAILPILSRENSKQNYRMSVVQLSSTICSHALMELFWNQTTIREKKWKSISLQATGRFLGSQFQNRDGARSYVAGAICQALSIIYLMAYSYELSGNKGERVNRVIKCLESRKVPYEWVPSITLVCGVFTS